MTRRRPPTDRERQLNRVRARHYAARRRAGIAVAEGVEYGGDVLDMLVKLGWLADNL